MNNEIENPLEVSFKDVAWLQTFPLNLETALEYFSLSPFYDRTCNNQVLKMQTAYNNFEQLKQCLSRMIGIEYTLIDPKGSMCFCIRKQNRTGPLQTTLIASYYILEGTIYQCPDLYSILTLRLKNSMFYTEGMLRIATEKVRFNGTHLFKSPITRHPIDEAEARKAQEKVDSVLTLFLNTPDM